MAYDLRQISVTPTIDTAAYVSGDRLGSVMTFSSAAQANGGKGAIVGCNLQDAAASNFDIQLWLFTVTPTLVNADNGVFDITDANLVTADLVGVIDFWAAHANTVSTSSRMVPGSVRGAIPVFIPYSCNASDTALYGIMKAMGSYDAAATTDLTVRLFVRRES